MNELERLLKINNVQSINNEHEYKLLLNDLNSKIKWRSKFVNPKTIYVKQWGNGDYAISGILPLDDIFNLITISAIYVISNSMWEYKQIKKTVCKAKFDSNIEPSFDDFAKVWEKHCKKIMRWGNSWSKTPTKILNEIIPTLRLTIPKDTRLYIVQKYKNICQYCGQATEKIHLDHILPVCQGGKNNKENLVVACPKCNLKKSGKTPQQSKMKLIFEIGE